MLTGFDYVAHTIAYCILPIAAIGGQIEINRFGSGGIDQMQ